MGQGADQQDCNCHAGCGQQAHREEASSQLREVEREGGLEDQAGYERQENHVGADARELPARKKSDHDAGGRQHHGIRQHRRAPRDEAEQCCERADQDEQQQKSLLWRHSSRLMPSRAAFTSMPSF